MLRDMLSFCINSIQASGSYSLRHTQYANETRLFVHFWAGNSLYSLCIGLFPGRLSSPASLLLWLSSFFALFRKEAHLLFLTGFAPRFLWTVSRVLPQQRSVCSFPKFDGEDLERTMLVPSLQSLDRFDFRNVLDCLLVRLRSACDRSWLSSLLDFKHVSIIVLFHFMVFFLHNIYWKIWLVLLLVPISMLLG